MPQSQPSSRSCRTAKTCWRWCKPDSLQLIVSQSTTKAFFKLTPNSAYVSDSFSLKYNEFSEDVFEKLDECDKIRYWRWISPLRITDCNLMDGWFFLCVSVGEFENLELLVSVAVLKFWLEFSPEIVPIKCLFACYLVLHFSNISFTLITTCVSH